MAAKLIATLALLAAVRAADDIVTVSGGSVLGVRDAANNVRFWKGIPFGADMGGSNRFRPPVPRASWAPTVLNCTAFAAGCWSNHHGVDTAPVKSEDCLNLNIYAPLNSTLQPGAQLPVMFFMYGGGFDEGDSEGPFDMYDGSYMASSGNVVVVTINYRLGALGFLVTDEIPGNLGLMDQRLAMQWVQDNIHVFGGDKTQVTIWGESAGAMSVGAHLIAPKSHGLFSKAIMESTVDMLYLNKSRAALYGNKFCELLNCTQAHGACDTACMQRADMKNVLSAWSTAAGDIIVFIRANWGHIEDGLLEFIPSCCDDMIPDQYVPAIAKGMMAPVPILAGTNTDEGATFVFDGVPWLPMFLYEDAIRIVFGRFADTIIEYYSRFDFHDGRDALSAVFTDYWFRCPTEKFLASARAQGQNAWFYRYNHELSASWLFPKFGLPTVCEKRVCHASELPMVFHHTVFPALNLTLPPDEVKLANQMTAYWTSFARTGMPNATFPWPVYNATSRPNIILQETMTTENTVELCSMWDMIGYTH
eukprot:m.226020 g.226020  ORF g.226020 m.226020 type:complete len:533 (+) comp11358_c0_seq1:20-1618(+)